MGGERERRKEEMGPTWAARRPHTREQSSCGLLRPPSHGHPANHSSWVNMRVNASDVIPLHPHTQAESTVAPAVKQGLR
ncbi:hypothetical protein GJAV_G00172060 [Gymnothorax javanicus]|nr:hypothetical protein GJAV_G00172060 [Gymnothorax javanicus]